MRAATTPSPQPSIAPASPRLLSRRTLLAGLAAVPAGMLVYSNEFARHHFEVVERTFFLRNLPRAFDGFRLAQISDIHLEEFTEDFMLRKVVAQVNALAPDLVVVTGDFVSRGPLEPSISLAAAGRCAELLRSLTCPLRFGILGNHDAMVGPRVVRDHMENNGLPLLVNQFTRIERGGEHIYLGGLDDVCWGLPNLSLSVPRFPDAPTILLCHEPDYANDIVGHALGRNVDLILSGHTHGGQVRIPGLPPLGLPPWGRVYVQGHFQVGSAQLYVNRGIGNVGVPLRLNSTPEITLATLRPQLPSS